MENPLANAPSSIEWVETLELGYEQGSPDSNDTVSTKQQSVCFACGKQPSQQAASTDGTGAEDAVVVGGEAVETTKTTSSPRLMKCSKCHVATYCSRDCQINDWKNGGHKRSCDSYKRLATITTNKKEEEEDGDNGDAVKLMIRMELFARIRFYACPYAIFKFGELGRGFLFIQSNETLRNLSLAIPKDEFGKPMPHGRSILMHYLTMGEFGSEVCREDFELTMVRSKLQDVVDTYDPDTEVVLLWRLRCGHVAVGKSVLVPDVGICRKLGMDYYSSSPAGAVQLNLDNL